MAKNWKPTSKPAEPEDFLEEKPPEPLNPNLEDHYSEDASVDGLEGKYKLNKDNHERNTSKFSRFEEPRRKIFDKIVRIESRYTAKQVVEFLVKSLPETDDERTAFLNEFQSELWKKLPEFSPLRTAGRSAPLSDNTSKRALETRAAVSTLPERALEIYQGLRGPETPPEFVRRVYGPWLGQGLTRAHFRKLDPKLYTAIDNWLSRPGNEWPADVDLPTKAEQNTRDIAALTEGEGTEVLGKFTGKEAARLAQALYRRSK